VNTYMKKDVSYVTVVVFKVKLYIFFFVYLVFEVKRILL